MILMRVDLQAPLSPSRPRTSPLRRCRLTSRSAVTGPKRLAMCSTRRTSSDDVAGATAPTAAPGSSATGTPPAGALDVHVRGHRHDDRKTRVEEQVVGVDALQDE